MVRIPWVQPNTSSAVALVARPRRAPLDIVHIVQSARENKQDRSILQPNRPSLPPCSVPSRCGLETPEVVERSSLRPILTAPARAGVRKLRLGRKKAAGGVEPKK